MPHSNEEIARMLERLADLSELKGELVFKVRAYQRAARSVEQQSEPLEQWVRDGRDLKEIPGIGKEIAAKIAELVTTGRMTTYEKLKTEFPEGVLALLDIPGVGPKTALRLAQELHINSVQELEQVIAALRERCPGVQPAVPVGSMRRWRETVGDVDLMVLSDRGQEVLDALVKLPMVVEVLAHGGKKASVQVSGGLQIDLRVVERESFGAMLQYFTGSKEHNVVLREYVGKRGLSLNEYGITDLKTEKLAPIASEEEFYQRLGLPWIPPELREGGAELEAVLVGKLPKLVEVADLKGDLHVHSDWSDGWEPLEVMLAAAKARGYEYVALTDHSVGRGIANGLSPERLREQRKLVRAAEKRLGIRVLHGAEVDIRADGRLDYAGEVLAELDLVVASVHSAMEQDRETMTERILKAMRSPHVDVIGHPTTRLIGQRPPIEVDMEALFQEAARTGVALEINAHPDRLDLKDVHIACARELGALLVINSDAHDAAGLDVMRFGVATARRGWCEAKHIVNMRPLPEFLAWLERERAT
ncbi:MAG: PHP domain-containing protein [Dehalococcoidia bacterium]|nr:PHP domain-containing protein [Dehalococcoidia bacterium]